MKRLVLVLVLLGLVSGIAYSQPQWPSQYMQGSTVPYFYLDGTKWIFRDPNTDSILFAIQTAQPQVEFNPSTTANIVMQINGALTQSNVTTVSMYAGGKASQTYGTGFIDVATTFAYITTVTAVTFSAPFTSTPAISVGIIPLLTNATTYFTHELITPTADVCTVKIYKTVRSAANEVTVSEATTNEVSLAVTAIGR